MGGTLRATPRHAAAGRAAASRGDRRPGAARQGLRRSLLATGAAGLVVVPVTGGLLTESPQPASAAVQDSGPAVTPLRSSAGGLGADGLDAGLLASGEQAGDLAVARIAADQQAALAAAQQAAAVQAAQAAQAAQAQRAAEEQAALDRASRSRDLAAPADTTGTADSATAPAPDASPKAIAQQLLAARGQASQFGCLDKLWTRESGWSTSADNPSSSAYGIPQALPGSKMASAGADWRTSARTQITWGLSYIASSYGSPCAAWSHSQSHNWY